MPLPLAASPSRSPHELYALELLLDDPLVTRKKLLTAPGRKSLTLDRQAVRAMMTVLDKHLAKRGSVTVAEIAELLQTGAEILSDDLGCDTRTARRALACEARRYQEAKAAPANRTAPRTATPTVQRGRSNHRPSPRGNSKRTSSSSSDDPGESEPADGGRLLETRTPFAGNPAERSYVPPLTRVTRDHQGGQGEWKSAFKPSRGVLLRRNPNRRYPAPWLTPTDPDTKKALGALERVPLSELYGPFRDVDIPTPQGPVLPERGPAWNVLQHISLVERRTQSPPVNTRRRQYPGRPPIFKGVHDWTLILRWRDFKDSTAFDALLRRHLDLLREGPTAKRGYQGAKVKGGDHPGVDGDDFESVALSGFLNAVETFNPHRTANFKTYAKTCIRHEKFDLRDNARTAKNIALGRSLSLDEEIGEDDEGDPLTRHDVVSNRSFCSRVGDNGDPVAKLIDHEALTKTWGSWSQRECEVVAGYVNGHDPEETAKRLGWRRGSGDNAFQRARRKFYNQAGGHKPRPVRSGWKFKEPRKDRPAGATRTVSTVALRGWGAVRDHNLKHGRDTRSGGMPWGDQDPEAAAEASAAA